MSGRRHTTSALVAAVQLKERLAALRGPARLNPATVHTEIWAAHRDALRLVEQLVELGDI